MKLYNYETPHVYEELHKHYYINKDGYLYTKINESYYDEYYDGKGFGLTFYEYDSSLIFNI